jgi:DNA-binding response OmpR family regulator
MVMRCLLVSVDQLSADVVEAAASSEGWLAEKCAAIDQALRLVFRQQFHLAFVDIHSTTSDALRVEYEQLASDLARNHVPLLVISGDPTDPLAEIHARQLGVWLYLPGFDGRTELDVVFREARLVHEKLGGRGFEKSSNHVSASKEKPVDSS